ncbi:MAG: hypothetical protein WCT04_20990 [Planctomycetota bacterium]
MNDSSALYSLVLIGRYPGKDMAVAQALARCMGREDTWGLRIVSSSPIVFFDKLNKKQATQLDAALADVANAGCRFEIQPGPLSSLPKVGWANPPKFNGRSLADIAPGAEASAPGAVRLPTGGYAIQGSPAHHAAPTGKHTPAIKQMPTAPRIVPSAPSIPTNFASSSSSALGAQPELSTQASTSLFIACPYTGQKIKLTLNIALTRGDGGVGYNVSASAASTPVWTTEKPVQTNTGTVIPPVAPHARQTGPQMQMRQSGGNSRPTFPIPLDFGLGDSRSGPADLPVVENREQPVADDARSGPSPWRRHTPTGVSLPDVPNLPSRKMPEPTFAPASMQPLPLDSTPMDISTFEASLGIESNESVRSFVNAESGVFVDLIAPDLGDDTENDDQDVEALCSIFIERSSSPVVHELVAELHGIPETEAAQLCVAGSVALAENIPLFEARDIKLRCAAINVFARIVRQE